MWWPDIGCQVVDNNDKWPQFDGNCSEMVV